MVFGAPWIGYFFHNPSVEGVMRAMSVSFVISSFSIVPSALLTRELKFDRISKIVMVSSFVYGVVSITMALVGFGVWSLILGPIAGVLTNALCLSCAASYYPAFGFRLTCFKALFNFGGLVTISSLLNHAARNADNLIVGRYLGSESLGLYSKAYNLATIPKDILVSVFGSVLFPSFARIQQDKDRVRDAFFKSINIITLVALPIGAAFLVMAPEFMGAVYGPKWSGCITPLRILSLAGFMYALYIPCTSLLLGLGKTRLYTTLQVVYSGVIVLSVLLVFRNGIEYIASAVAIAIMICMITLLYSVHRLVGLSLYRFWSSTKVAIKGTLLMIVSIESSRAGLRFISVQYDSYMLLIEIIASIVVYYYYISVSKDDVVDELRTLIRAKMGQFAIPFLK
jgi:PST family polysaccharide transporter